MNIRFSNKYLQKTGRLAEQGFTIVELIVVIVVIAILASITLVAYNGIRDRAYNVKTVSDVRSYVNMLNSNLLLNGPIVIDDIGGSYYYCIGSAESYPATASMAAGKCSSDPSFNVRVSNKFNTALKEYGEIDVDGREITATDGSKLRGIIGVGNSTIWYFLRGKDQSCPIGTPSELGANTLCYYTFADPVVKVD